VSGTGRRAAGRPPFGVEILLCEAKLASLKHVRNGIFGFPGFDELVGVVKEGHRSTSNYEFLDFFTQQGVLLKPVRKGRIRTITYS
jgi:hypothetical protein